MSHQDLVENRIQDAIAAGHFSGLPGEGAPLRFDPAGENWLGYKILRDSGSLPAWLLLAREIERAEHDLRRLEARYTEWVHLARHSGRWGSHAAGLQNLARRIREAALALRRMQDRYNIEAPSLALERPGLWVEHRLAALSDCLRAAGAPPELLAASDLAPPERRPQ